MQDLTIKTKTSNGKPIAAYTMVTVIKPEYQLPNKNTGEICTRWTYRSDLEQRKFAKQTGIGYKKEVDVLGLIYHRFKNRWSEVKIFSNKKPVNEQLIYHELNGKIIIPVEIERQKKFHEWLKKCL